MAIHAADVCLAMCSRAITGCSLAKLVVTGWLGAPGAVERLTAWSTHDLLIWIIIFIPLNVI